MRKIFWGFLVIYIGLGIGILPGFIGYILVALGLNQLAEKYERLEKTKFWAVGLAVLTAITSAMLFRGMVSSDAGRFLITALVLLAPVYLIRQILQEFKRIEQVEGQNLNSTGLNTSWWILIICAVTSLIFRFLTLTTALIGAIITLVSGIYFLVSFHKTMGLYCMLERNEQNKTE